MCRDILQLAETEVENGKENTSILIDTPVQTDTSDTTQMADVQTTDVPSSQNESNWCCTVS